MDQGNAKLVVLERTFVMTKTNMADDFRDRRNERTKK